MPNRKDVTLQPTASVRLFALGLIAGLLLVDLVVAGLAGCYLYNSRQMVEARVATQTQNLSQSLSLTLAGILDQTGTALFSVKEEAERQLRAGGLDLKILDDYILKQQKRIPELDGLRVADSAGYLICGDRVVLEDRVTFTGSEVFSISRQNPNAGLVIGPPKYGRISKHQIFHLAYRINNPDGSFAGVVFGAISLDYLRKMFSSFDLGPHGAITLRDKDLVVVARYPDAGSTGYKKVSREWQEMRRARKTSGTYKSPGSIDTVERTFSFNQVSNYPLFINVGMASNDYFVSWRGEGLLLGSFVILFWSASVVSGWVICRAWKQAKVAKVVLEQHREQLEDKVRTRTIELKDKNLHLAEEIAVRKLAEANWHKAAVIMDQMSDAVLWVSKEGRFLYVNDAACNIHGYSRDEMLSLSILDMALEFPPEAWVAHWEDMTLVRHQHFETRNKARDGRVFPVEVTATYHDFDGIEYICSIVRDLTDRRENEAEKQTLITQLAQAQKMESVGRLAGGIAHDFNNLLTPIMGYAELLRNSLAPQGRELERIDHILDAADRAKALIQQLLSFSRKQVLEMKIFDINEVIRSFYNIVRSTIREDIDLRLHLTGDVLGVQADQHQVCQIMMNLAINAQDAIEGIGSITIETALISIDAEYLRQHTGVAEGEYLMLAVTDSGCGMDQETLSHLFEPFFTTKEVGHGTGLGLATVYGLVRQHGGHIWVYSEKGTGTVFKIYFPIIKEKPAVKVEKPAQGPLLNVSGRTILLVEDNDMVRQLAHDILQTLGADILTAEGPKQALLLSAGKRVDLLLTDVVMPDMNGPELHRRLLKSHPCLKVLYMSGYTNNAIVHHEILDGSVDFIEKPFTFQELSNKVQSSLTA
jgi:two-component system, cell cycle sensor histidine kinase and response regulator CckA